MCAGSGIMTFTMILGCGIAWLNVYRKDRPRDITAIPLAFAASAGLLGSVLVLIEACGGATGNAI